MTSIACIDVDKEHIEILQCYVKAQRNKFGMVNLVFTYKNVDNDIFNMQLFHQNSAGRFLPYLVNSTFDLCEASKHFYEGDKLVQLIMRAINLKSQAAQSCPFNVRGTLYILYLGGAFKVPFPF